MSGDLRASEGVGEVVYLEGVQTPQKGAQELPGVYLAISADKRGECVGCGCPVVRRATWRKLPAATKKSLRNAGIRQLEARGLCRGCYSVAAESGRREEFRKSDWSEKVKEKVSAEKSGIQGRVDFPATWAEIQGAGGGPSEMAELLGITRERVRQIVLELGLPRKHSLKVRAQIFLEELEHLAGLGMGVQYIARALGMTPDALVKKVDHLHQTGKTKVYFATYNRRYDKEATAA